MGRHSAPDDEDDAPSVGLDLLDPQDVEAGGPEVEDSDATRGRHARRDDAAVTHTIETAATGAATVADTAAIPVRPPPDPSMLSRLAPTEVARGAAHNSAADLALARTHPSVLVLCVLAIVLPFVAEVVVLLVLGTLDAHSFLVWIWAPIVGAGIQLGAVLDLAHRHYDRRSAPPR